MRTLLPSENHVPSPPDPPPVSLVCLVWCLCGPCTGLVPGIASTGMPVRACLQHQARGGGTLFSHPAHRARGGGTLFSHPAHQARGRGILFSHQAHRARGGGTLFSRQAHRARGGGTLFYCSHTRHTGLGGEAHCSHTRHTGLGEEAHCSHSRHTGLGGEAHCSHSRHTGLGGEAHCSHSATSSSSPGSAWPPHAHGLPGSNINCAPAMALIRSWSSTLLIKACVHRLRPNYRVEPGLPQGSGGREGLNPTTV